MAHEEQKAIWIDKSLLNKLKIASALRGMTIKKYIEDAVNERLTKDLAGIDLEQRASNEVAWEEE